MLSALAVVLPVFALIFAGYLARRLGALGAGSSSELTRFVVYLSLPAMLFEIMASAKVRELWQPGFVGAFGGGCLAVFALTWWLSRRKGLAMADASVDSLSAAYANTGFVGFPLCLLAFGQQSLPPTTIAVIITVCVVFGFAIILVELGLQSEMHPGHALRHVTESLARNPMLVAPALGLLVAMAGLPIPAGVDAFLKLLGGASSPCALVSLGVFLAGERANYNRVTAAQLVTLKLVVHPAITWLLAFHVFAMPKVWAEIAVLLAALPTGTGSFMVAELYNREADTISATVLYSTIGSLFTITAYLYRITP